MSSQNRKKTKMPVLGIAIEPIAAYTKLLRAAISSTNHSESAFLEGALRAKRFDLLLEWSDRPSPQLYDSSTDYFVDCQLSALIKKYPFSRFEVPGLDPQATALSKFESAEHKCKRVNQKFRAKRRRFDPYMQLKCYMREFILSTVGPSPDLLAIGEKCDFTSGASLLVGGSKTNIARKVYAQSWTSTPGALPYAIPMLWANAQLRDCILPGAMKCYDKAEFGRIVRAKVQHVNYNKVDFVPKTAKTHRGIAVEPLLNGFIQKGTDVYLRDRLRAIGIDLSDQTRNQRLARLGSLGGFDPFVTVDLSAASDSLAYEVVRELLPADWFEYLDFIRSPQYLLPDSKVPKRYEKFCSMGNGFCFPLQTLIFASVVYAASRFCKAPRDQFAVYGDDIIVRQSEALLVVELLRELGFRTNVDKTFITGPFRESCGADWYEGQDVRPVHFAEPLVDVRQLFALHNSTLRSPRCELFFEEFRTVARSIAGSSYLRPGREPGDTAYSVPLDVAMNSPSVRWDRDRMEWRWTEIASKSVKDPCRLGVVEYANALVLAAMRGTLSSQPFTLRYETNPKIVSVCRPFFDGYRQKPPIFWRGYSEGVVNPLNDRFFEARPRYG